MIAQLMEEITVTMCGWKRGGRGAWLIALLCLSLSACSLTPAVSDADKGLPAADDKLEPLLPHHEGSRLIAATATPQHASGTLRTSGEQAPAVAPVAPKHVVSKPVVSKTVTPKTVTPKTTAPAKRASKAVEGTGNRPRQKPVSTTKRIDAVTPVSPPQANDTAKSATGPAPEALPRTASVKAKEPAPSSNWEEYVRLADALQNPQTQAPSAVELPPQKAAAERRTTSRKRKRSVTAKIETIHIGDTRIEMVRLRGGYFEMGSNSGDVDELPLHPVTLPAFSIGRYEVTQRQWVGVMGSNPSHFNDCSDCPVDNVSWDDAQQFIVKLNQQTGKQFRLPSEAEWEYACGAGGNETYCGDSDETQVAWYAQNSGGRSHPVGRLEPNAFGLHDMSGNAYEWVADCWNDGYSGAPTDGQAWNRGECQRRVLRGGAWYYAPAYAASTYRNANTAYSRFIIYGFRLAHDE